MAPIFKKLLIGAIVLYIASSAYIQYDLSSRLGEVEHKMEHLEDRTRHSENEDR
jgi:hypothetical protein